MSKRLLLLSLFILVLTASSFIPGRSVAAFLKNSSPLISPITQKVSVIGQNLISNPLENNENVLPIPLITQSKNLSCEAASIKMILDYFGKSVSEEEIQTSFPKHPNPNKGFRGKVSGRIWGFADYGTYPDVVAKTMKRYGVSAKPYYDLSEASLKEMVLSGKPAIIWVNIANPSPKIRNITVGGETVRLVSGEHTVVVTGFEDGQWILNDPWRRTSPKGERISEIVRVTHLEDIYWDFFDHMAVVVD